MDKRILIAAIPVFIALIAVVPSVRATHFPCEGGTGDIYCKGYHDGAVQADNDDAKGFLDVTKHPCDSEAEYCAGYDKGYDDEGGQLQ